MFDTVADAVRATGANSAVIYVPPMAAAGAVFEAADAGIPLVVCITEGIPVMHMSRVMPFVQTRGARLIGPNCPGADHPRRRAKVGIIPGNICAAVVEAVDDRPHPLRRTLDVLADGATAQTTPRQQDDAGVQAIDGVTVLVLYATQFLLFVWA